MTSRPHELHVIHGSHPCAAVEVALQLKGQSYRTRELLPPTQVVIMRRRFGAPTVPAIRFDDGEQVQGSMAIMKRLDERWPEPPLYPSDPDLRAAADEAERWGDDDLQMIARRLLFTALRKHPSALASFSNGGRIRVPKLLTTIAAPVVAAAERRIHRMTPQQVARDIEQLPQTFDRIDAWIAGGVLGTSPTSAADLQVFSSIRILLTLQDVRDRFSDRSASRRATELFPDYAGNVPAGALG